MTHILTNSALERALKEVEKKSWTEQVIVVANTPKSAKIEWVNLSEAKRIIRELVDGMQQEQTERRKWNVPKGLGA